MDITITEKITKPTICLNMIVKNEEHIIEKTLKMLISKINFDYWVICDTGSTDNTKQIIQHFFSEKQIQGTLLEDTWVNFAHNRNLALENAYNKTDLLLIFDADDELHGEIIIPQIIDNSVDGYNLFFAEQEGVVSYKRTLLINNHIKWEYRSVLHEYIVCLKDDHKIVDLPGNYYLVSGRSGSRNKDPNKYLNDALLLENAWKIAIENNDNLYLRYAFYCANSYKDHGNFEEAIKWYKITLGQNNWNQEKYMSCLNLFKCYKRLHQTETGVYYLVESIKYDKERVECIFYLIEHYSSIGLYNIAYNYYLLIKEHYENVYTNQNYIDKLFAENEIYTFLLPYYVIIVADKVKNEHPDYLKTVKNMFSIVFKKKYKITNPTYIGNFLYNFCYFINYIEITNIMEEFSEYIGFMVSIGHNFNDPKYEFLTSLTKIGFNIETNKFSEEECKNCKNILFYTGYMNFKWNYTYSLNNSLGGSESAVINLAFTFPKNYNIYITGNVEEENIDNIHFVSSDNLDKLFDSMPFYYVIVSRYIDFYEKYCNASYYRSLIWAHDVRLLNYGINMDANDILCKWNKKISYCICQTEWHKNLFKSLYSSLASKLTNINNGISIEKFIFEPFKILNRFIYTSCAERGLNKLLDLWPQISQMLPNCELLICSYNDFPRDDNEVMIQNKIKQYKNVAHLGKLDKSKLYELMSSAEYWLYPTDFSETSCITAMEMLASEVICIYYPVAGLVNTLGQYGISVKEGEEMNVIMNLTNNDKNILRKNGKKYAESCCWKNRFVSWNNILQIDANNTTRQKLVFYYDNKFTINPLIDYFDSLNELYDVSYTSLKDDLHNIKNSIVLFIVYLLDINIVIDFINNNINGPNFCAFFNTEPLNTTMFLNSCLNLHKLFPNMSFFDYSKSNLPILNNNGINNVKILEYIPYEKETNYLHNLLVTTNKIYDFGIIEFDRPLDNFCWRRKHCINALLANGFKILIISGWKHARDSQLAKCKYILNIHGQNVDYEWPKEEHTTQIFEHIRCNRLLAAGFNILSESSLNLEPNFIKKYPNLLLMDYNEILKLTPQTFFSNIEKIETMFDLIDNRRTDKNTTHSYLDLYQRLLQHKKQTATNILEVGICAGGSIKLWHDYFTNAIVHGLDIMVKKDIWTQIIDKERIKLYLETDAYNNEFFKQTFLSSQQKFDMVLDDGPHTLVSMIKFISLYSQLLKDDGLLIVEDIQDYSWLEILTNATPEHLKPFIRIYDLRKNKNRYDDILFMIDLTNK